MFENAQERVKLMKKGLSGKEIERLYVEHNNFKITHKTILYEANDFEFARSFFDNNGKTISKPVLVSVALILVTFFPISTLFNVLVLMLFVPPIFALAMIISEGKSLILNELKCQ